MLIITLSVLKITTSNTVSYSQPASYDMLHHALTAMGTATIHVGTFLLLPVHKNMCTFWFSTGYEN